MPETGKGPAMPAFRFCTPPSLFMHVFSVILLPFCACQVERTAPPSRNDRVIFSPLHASHFCQGSESPPNFAQPKICAFVAQIGLGNIQGGFMLEINPILSYILCLLPLPKRHGAPLLRHEKAAHTEDIMNYGSLP